MQKLNSVLVPVNRVVIVVDAFLRVNVVYVFEVIHVIKVVVQENAVHRAFAHFQVHLRVIMNVIDTHLLADREAAKSHVLPALRVVHTRVDQRITYSARCLF